VAAPADVLVASADAGAANFRSAEPLGDGTRRRGGPRASLPAAARALRRGQAFVEAALVLPVLLLLVFGVAAVGRLTLAQSSVSAVAREAARAAAGASSGPEAVARGLDRGRAVAEGYGLAAGALELELDADAFGRGGWVQARARYTVRLSDLPLLGWTAVRVQADDRERVERYQSLWR
jgi:hypothetical protein